MLSPSFMARSPGREFHQSRRRRADMIAARGREGSTSPGRLAQGEYGARVGVPRILDLLRRHDLRASFFVPGVIARLHPDEQRRVVAEGHEVGMHGWIHEGTSELTESSERDLM